MEQDSDNCKICKGKKFFHIGDRIAFSGDKSYFSLAGLADAAKIAGLRVHGANDNIIAVITKGSISDSESLKRAKKKGIKIMTPEEFQKLIIKVCDGNVPNRKNPRLSTLIGSDTKIFAWGLSEIEEKILNDFCKRNRIARWKVRKPSLTFAVTSSIYTNSGDSKILKSMGVPVYNFSRVKKILEN